MSVEPDEGNSKMNFRLFAPLGGYAVKHPLEQEEYEQHSDKGGQSPDSAYHRFPSGVTGLPVRVDIIREARRPIITFTQMAQCQEHKHNSNRRHPLHFVSVNRSVLAVPPPQPV